ncbi:MAG: hypothetical protein IJN65_01315 [Clostridia bacterium]|nr:hypothetical protein [Clostridia bacterium]
MRKFLVCILILSMLVLCSCQTNIETPQVSDTSSILEENINSEKSNEAEDNAVSENSQSTTAQPQKTVINVTPQTAKMVFTNPGNSVSNASKEYVTDKVGKLEKYTKSNVQDKTFNVLGTDYANLEYCRSEKRIYTGQEYDVFENSDTKINVQPNGDIIYFYTEKPQKFFPNELSHSEKLAKKYLEKIFPNYEYDSIKLTKIDSVDWYDYVFFKTINGVRTSDSISILMNSSGALRSYMITDTGKYDHIDIKNLNINDFIKRIDDYATKAYGDTLIAHGLHADGPYINIFTDNKLELTIPIWVKFKASDSNEYEAGEYVVFELN